VTYPEGWRVFEAFQDKKTVRWADTKYNRLGFSPGDSLSGFSISSRGIPGIVKCYAGGYTKIPSFEYGQAPFDVRPGFFGNSVGGKTVGPVKTAADFSPVDILDHLISIVEESFTLGWIENKQLTDLFLSNLREIKDDLVEGRMESSVDKLKKLQDRFEFQKESKLTSEAFSILKYNIELIFDKLL
jgi:hypothetical protein